jgi:predicted CxxxxCH...CXXCH cytochrome family protein
VYCHGATLAGGTLTTPTWTRVDGTQAACGTCHGLPPPPSTGHPAVTGGVTICAGCHPGTVDASGRIVVSGGLHINGQVDVANLSCTSCHGDAARGANAPAPPRSTRGETATTARAVGAHQQHLTASPLRAAVACSECHVVPTSTSHTNGVVEVTFGALARTGGAAPVWNGASCSASYCHGNFRNGNAANAPTWTRVDGTQAACGTCHSIPPGGTHPQGVTQCGSCHDGYSQTSVNVALHMNGSIDVKNLTCTSCHGDGARARNPAAPPSGTHGETLASARAVGAHQSHVQASPLRDAVNCSECHAVPTSTSHTNGKVELAFGPLATAGGAAPVWNGTSCSASYCHGNFKNGNTTNAPVWTRVDGSQAACGSCHGIPPGGTHPQGVTNCGGCHPGYTATSVAVATHINGAVDVNLTCTSCHGTPGSNPAPPNGTHGETVTTARAVGAHQSHVTAGGLAAEIDCSACHVKPTSTSHSNGKVEVTFAGLAAAGGAAPVWNGASCSASYCHGNFKNGNSANAPTWTRVDGSQAACGTCHGIPPGGTHPQGVTQCGSCHDGYSQTTVNVALHVNGRVDVKNLTCTSCHGTPGANPAPPFGTHGETATSARAVGAHQSHVTGSSLAGAIDCSVCHVKPTSTSHSNGTVEVQFSGLAAGSTWTGTTCATYCHGATLQGGRITSPTWTTVNGTQAACGACHGIAPPTGRHSKDDHVKAGCGACHAGYSPTTVNASSHVNGRVDLGGSKIKSYDPATKSCSPACHETKTWTGGG